ncbi:Site-specific recombinase XerD [Rhizobiales bacterium GAS113]|nr:Site-specific recombinase XerD [Rhizobiales bacterium GAS113]
MVLSMSQPWKHPKTGVWYFRGRVPAELRDKLKGRKLSLRVGGEDRTVTLSEFAKVSLGTKDNGEAKLRHAAVQSQLQERWAAAAKGPVSLSHEEIMALAGVGYRDLVSEFRSDPGDSEGWEVYQEQLTDALAHFDETSDGVTREPYDPKTGTRELSRHFDLDQFLGARGLSLDEPSRLKLLQQLAYAQVLAARTLERFAHGDYSADRQAERYPAWRAQSAARDLPKGGDGSRLEELISGWAKEAQPKPATLDLWRSYLTDFIAFVGHDNAHAFRRQDVVAWKQKLLDDGNSVKTVNDSKLAALKAVLGWAVDNEHLSENAAARVSVKRGKKAGEDMLGFSKPQAATILRAAAESASPVYRWVPLLCATSGARVSEICQLRAEDIQSEDGVWLMRFRHEAGSLKNPGSQRDVPLHPRVIDAGFLDFLKSRKGHLFFDPQRRKAGAKKPQPKIVAKNVAAWVHRLGIEVGRKLHRKDPNHAWRHLFKSLGRDAGIQDSVLDAITGNAPPTVGQAYGETWLVTAARAIARISLPDAIEATTTSHAPPASHGAVAAMAVASCQVDEAVFVNALAKGIGRNDALAVAKLERKRYQEGFTEEVAKVRIGRKRKGG